jgi:hypothetical protein
MGGGKIANTMSLLVATIRVDLEEHHMANPSTIPSGNRHFPSKDPYIYLEYHFVKLPEKAEIEILQK